MGEEITLKGVEMINGGSLQIDIYFEEQQKGARFFCEAEQFFSMLGKSMTESAVAWNKKWAEDNGLTPLCESGSTCKDCGAVCTEEKRCKCCDPHAEHNQQF